MAHSNLTLGFDAAVSERGLRLFLCDGIRVDIHDSELVHELVQDLSLETLNVLRLTRWNVRVVDSPHGSSAGDGDVHLTQIEGSTHCALENVSFEGFEEDAPLIGS